MSSPVTHLPVYIGPDAIERLLEFCRSLDLSQFALVADANTYQAIGRRAAEALRVAGYDVSTLLLEGNDIGANADYVLDVMRGLDRVPRTFIAAGSGTITDITRFVSHRTGREFISLPTAPSVDGYTSVGAPMVIRGVKLTVPCQGPLAVFADLPTLCAAPRALLAAGFGDMLAKLTSSADWEIGALLWGEPWDPAIASRGRAAAWACVEEIGALAAAECSGVSALMSGLIESGFCMLDFGDTRPASGYEHHVSHLWEMKLLAEGRHSVFHGAKVGIAVVHSLGLYDALGSMDRDEVARRLAAAQLPARDALVSELQARLGPIANEVLATQAPFLDMTEAEHARLKARILQEWDKVQAVAQTLPPAAQMVAWLRLVGGPASGAEIGLSEQEVAWGLRYGHYFRRRFSGAKLCHMLGMPLA